jgi:hypothetical protein
MSLTRMTLIDPARHPGEKDISFLRFPHSVRTETAEMRSGCGFGHYGEGSWQCDVCLIDV